MNTEGQHRLLLYVYKLYTMTNIYLKIKLCIN